MRTLNRMYLIGRIGKKPELKKSQKGTSWISFPVATSDWSASAQKSNTHWHQVVAWNGTSEFLGQNADKGDLVFVEGTLHARKSTSPEYQGRTFYEIHADRVELFSVRNQRGAEKEMEKESSTSSSEDLIEEFNEEESLLE